MKCTLQFLSVLKQSCWRSWLCDLNRTLTSYLNCGAKQPLATRGTASLRPVKKLALLVSLLIPSVTNFKVKSLLKQRVSQLQRAQKVDCPPLQRDRVFERVEVRARAKTQMD